MTHKEYLKKREELDKEARKNMYETYRDLTQKYIKFIGKKVRIDGVVAFFDGFQISLGEFIDPIFKRVKSDGSKSAWREPLIERKIGLGISIDDMDMEIVNE